MVKYEELYNILIEKFKEFHPNCDIFLIEKAYKLAINAHEKQKRKSGEPYIIHPLSVSIILADLGLDISSIIGGLLHDVIEDTKYNYEDIENMFGKEVALLVDGVTKLDKIKYQKEKIDDNENYDKNIEKKSIVKISKNEELQAENYRKMFLAMAKDIRVIVIKIADRLHNMRTLNYMDTQKQKEKAQETLDIYVPLAHRLGIAKVKYELEDLSLLYIDREGYYYVKRKLKYHQKKRQDIVKDIIKSIKDKMEAANIKGEVEGRPKHIYSIYRKMKRKNVDIDKIYDLFAVRVIVDTVMSCYSVLGIVHDFYIPIPGRFKDYISMPKENMYQSLHTTLTSKDFDPFELQIRTWDMHKTAEYGIAAHWRYKENLNKITKHESEEAKLTWLRQILEWQKELPDNEEYLDELKKELSIFKDKVYCFTPKGEIISLIVGSTPIDFAYSIHSSIGNQMIGVRVNSKIVPFNYELSTGDKVEIVTSRNIKGPKREWLNIVKTSHARSKIKQWFRKENEEKNIIIGKELLEEFASKKNIILSEILTEERKEYLLSKYNYSEWRSFLASIGLGTIKESQVINRLINKEKKDIINNKKIEILNKDLSSNDINLKDVLILNEDKKTSKKCKEGIIVHGMEDILVRLSKCCSPVPGDEIIGFITRGRGVSIHRTDCKNIINITKDDLKRLIEAEWENTYEYSKKTYRADLSIICENKVNLIVNILNVFSDHKIPVKSINTKSSSNNMAIIVLSIEVGSRYKLDRICSKILNIQGVDNIERLTI